MSNTFDVVVIGGGLSGLSAAYYLEKHGATAVVLEARDRVGGRTCTEDYDGARVDVGGAYIGPSQNRILRLAKELGVEHYPIPQQGTSVMQINGKHSTYEGLIPRINPIALLDLNHLMVSINQLASNVPVVNPWTAKNAKELDSMTVQQWLDQNAFSKDAGAILGNAMRSVLCAEPHEVSLLAFLWYTHSADGIIRMAGVENGAQERKFVLGSQTVSDRLAEKLKGGVRFNMFVNSVIQSESGVEVSTVDGQKFYGKRVILAIPPALYGKIVFKPQLPPMKSQLGQRMPMGSIIKTITLYEKPFWREHKMSGSFFSDESPVIYTLDDTKPDGSHPGIMGFILADNARKWTEATYEERKEAVCRQYAKMFGSEEAMKPTRYIEKNWMAEEFSGGCYVGIMPPGFLTRYGPHLTTTHGLVHFAGTETASFWSGYMDGAILAGEREAHRILVDLSQVSSNTASITHPGQFVEEAPVFEDLPGKPATFSW
eukprot:TRINITY_DN3123_c0_g1_i3.p1 TRINITY_DN3123_c0_g1~~TRINITY_DN3123_c0_g1_i3.p1  ORF type:complete len:486 (+),score=109.23 TRINITY_DN3123_c0_g1_i3:65-1522(+)